MTNQPKNKSEDDKHSEKKVLELEARIAELHEEIVTLRSDLFDQRDEIHTMRNSRVLGKIIKAHDTIGDPRALPKRAASRARRRVAEHVPDSIRLPLMKNLRAVRDKLKGRIEQYQEESVSIITTDLAVWDKKAPLVSVVVPYYNRADTIDDTLASLNAQTFRDFETIIVDDGSSDKESGQKLLKLKLDGLNLTIIKQKNQGVASARNNGVKHATGKYIVCLDSDDILKPTFIEKAVAVLEANPEASIVSTYMTRFGVINDEFWHVDFDPIRLYVDNMIITAAMFTKEGWQTVGGYKSGIGYEDWEFWLNLVEHGFWAKLIPESLFLYRTSMQSRYIQDKDVHWNNLKLIRSLHPKYKTNISAIVRNRKQERRVVDSGQAFKNTAVRADKVKSANANVLITIPWMTFGGAETLIYNFCREIKDDYNITFVTGHKSENEWEYKFREITDNIFHLPNLFDDPGLYAEYISNLISVKKIDTLHIIHNGFTFAMLEELKRRHPKLRVITTLFNDRVEYFEQSLKVASYVDTYTSDNNVVVGHFKQELSPDSDVRLLPNGVNTDDEFNPAEQDRNAVRKKLGIEQDELAAFFVGRLSVEKNPNVFVDVAQQVIKAGKSVSRVKFFIIGDGVMKASVEKQVATVHSNRLEYLGYQSAIAQYLSAADMFILPSSIEGFPLSILEAMAMEVVSIASRVGGVSDVIDDGENGFIVTPGSSKEITAIIKKLATDDKLREKLKKLSRNRIEKLYSNQVLGRNYRKLYGKK